MIDESFDWADPNAGPNYTYDAAGRLTDALMWGATYYFGYWATWGCPVDDAHLNTNRTQRYICSWSGGHTYHQYCYDDADRLVSSTDPSVGTIGYDAHGNMTTIGGETRGDDIADRHLVTNKDQRPSPTCATRRTASCSAANPRSPVRVWSGSNGTGATSVVVTRLTGTAAGDVILANDQRRRRSGDHRAGRMDPGPRTRPTAPPSARPSTGGSPPAATRRRGPSRGPAPNEPRPLPSRIVGLNTTAPIDHSATATSSSGTSHAAPAVTPTGTGRQLVNVWGVTGVTSFTALVGTVERADQATSAGTGAVTVGVADWWRVLPLATGTRHGDVGCRWHRGVGVVGVEAGGGGGAVFEYRHW